VALRLSGNGNLAVNRRFLDGIGDFSFRLGRAMRARFITRAAGKRCIARVGAGEYRVSTYGFDPRGLRWEVFVRLGEEPS